MKGRVKMSVQLHLIIILVLVCTVSCRNRDGEQSVKGQMDRVKSDTELAFPDNSKLEHFFEEPERLWDPVWVAKVVVPASSYESFKRDLVSRPDDKTKRNGSLADSTSWWKPINPILSKQYLATRDGCALVQVIVSKEEGEFSVYIEYMVF